MTDLKTVIANNGQAVTDFLTTAGAFPPAEWDRPRAPSKWSPGQVTEHLVLTYELGRGILHGTFAGPTAPRVVRPLIRVLLLKRVLRRGHFGKPAKTLASLEPAASPASAEVLAPRLQAAVTAFEVDMETAARSGQATLDHPFFGKIHLDDYVRFQMIHTHHHRVQLER